MKSISFFSKKNLSLREIFLNSKIKKNFIVNDVKPLDTAKNKDLTFFDSIKYKSMAAKTAAGACITTKSFEKFIPAKVEKIIVKNVLLELAHVLKKIYSNADIDYPDFTLKKAIKKKYKTVKFGNNVLVGKNVKIGKNSIIGSNTIIEHDVLIAIKDMKVRGAPLIGATAAFGIYLACKEDNSIERINEAAIKIKKTRPTAVNLFWAVDRMVSKLNSNKTIK